MAGQYSRSFITLKQERADYAFKGREAVGSAIVERRGNSAKVSVTVYNIKPRVLYKVYLIYSKEGTVWGVNAGSLNVDERGSGQLKQDFNAANVADCGIPIEEFNVIAVIVPKENELIVPLAGYLNETVMWKNNFVEYSKKRAAAPVEAAKPKPVEAPLEDVAEPGRAEVPAENVVDSEPKPTEVPLEAMAEPKFAEVPVEAMAGPKLTEAPVEAMVEPELTEMPTEVMAEPMLPEEPLEAMADPKSVETPVEAVAATNPAEAPIEAMTEPKPVETPVEAMAEPLPGEIPVEAMAEPKPVETPVEAMAKPMPAEMPVEAMPEQEPAETPVEAMAEPKPSEASVEAVAEPEPCDKPDMHIEFKAMAEKFNKELKELTHYTFLTEEELAAINNKYEDGESVTIKEHQTKNDLDLIFEEYATMTPFQRQNREVHWIRISPKELCLLPFDFYTYQCNPLILSAYRKYQHLILGRTGGKLEKGREYILGVPEQYHTDYRLTALKMGFGQFKCCEDARPREGDYGYWLMRIEGK